MRLFYTREAIGDLIRLREFIAIKNPKTGQKVAKTIRKGISQLKTFPYIGVEVEQAPNPKMIRDLIVGNYIVRYLIHEEQLCILRVWHHKEERL